ncbi:hypothetical protein SAMN06297129_3277 [Pseudooceanicola antarcticus]|uniref:DUF1289 domain-containing protein n=1 Tax=Pseudooceanicola antarcticus TaxID=1247613 RepID=A0A285J8K5_9RHOB|nr:DUF1289 domain-containing protein [Pseudooceanicola antarcticus]PJE27077.1 DUF1289 domain-containing protein [Pseudooceanicola antarcticus]SNY56393.1 hypothetical protein SAMN06297129_3277 [Pseudooceanicola antarcticus]
MSGEDFPRRNGISSPCVDICVIHPEARLCTGCLRSIDEIAGWGRMSEEERQAIMADLPARGPLKASRKGGRRGRMARGQ